MPRLRIIQRHSVLRSLHVKRNPPVLEVYIGIEPFQRHIFGTGKDIGLLLESVVQIPAVRRIIKCITQEITPEHLPQMISVIAGKSQAGGKIQKVRLISHIGVEDKIIIGQCFLHNEISRKHIFKSIIT